MRAVTPPGGMPHACMDTFRRLWQRAAEVVLGTFLRAMDFTNSVSRQRKESAE
jgi:hypothetical protein